MNVLLYELAMALDFLRRCMDDKIDDELHDDIALAANHFGWWMPDSQMIPILHEQICLN